MEDFPAWHFDPKGIFSVKSAYKLHVKISEREYMRDAESSYNSIGNLQNSGDRFWLNIWSLPCPSKIKMFIWRVTHNSLPVNMNLKRKRVNIEDTRCFLCHRLDEDGAHLFIKCKRVRQCWRLLNLETVRRDLEACSSASDVIHKIWCLPVKQYMLIVVMWWMWWENRNKIREGDPACSTENIVFRVQSYTKEYLNLFKPEKSVILKPVPKWKPPQQDQLKANVDGAYTVGNDFGGWGVIIREASGQIIAARAGKVQNVGDAFTAELHAVREAISLANQLGIGN
ncbi:uncharacterized protein LOC133898629 [Phragmites australis]|uniref:uncharacterized protein LOC133898629 n=1 Tax=Phragmites australis TaxID=29695 RepID=UPI002D76565C|nr:uncharacterized protein LOC133898629 [Phragmites australis]